MTNASTTELPKATGAAAFYSALLAVQRKDAALLKPAMRVSLPESDRRQMDMANAALLATTNNFVGNQPNYGFGATYWSYGREDNGSLPLDMLSVDDALDVCFLELYSSNDSSSACDAAPLMTTFDNTSAKRAVPARSLV